ncbi:hypothetical protein M0R72_13145 [Candidatus Pacearchaeota archaeon]|jgi:hypothetical protein|nr:hypothetical protein [Candidatus Pacearchaeota archaeon]
MDVVITITGKVTIADDDLKSVRAQNMEELATILHRHGKDIKTGVAVFVEGSDVPVPPRQSDPLLQEGPIKKASKKRRTHRRAKKV